MDVIGFSSLLGCLEGGRFDHDLSAALRGLISRMKHDHHDRGGKPHGRIDIRVQFIWEDGTIKTTQSFDVEPTVSRTPDRFFVTPEGALTQRSPQDAMPFTGVTGDSR